MRRFGRHRDRRAHVGSRAMGWNEVICDWHCLVAVCGWGLVLRETGVPRSWRHRQVEANGMRGSQTLRAVGGLYVYIYIHIQYIHICLYTVHMYIYIHMSLSISLPMKLRNVDVLRLVGRGVLRSLRCLSPRLQPPTPQEKRFRRFRVQC